MNLNQNRQSTLTQAFHHFQEQNYSQALRLYSSVLEEQSLSTYNCSLVQSTIAIIYIHLNNYPEAHRILTQMEQKIGENENNNPEHCLLFMKVHTSLALIQLLNCNENQAYEHIQQIMEKIKISERPTLLFRTAMKMLFGLQSFSLLYDHCNLALESLSYSGIMLSSLSINAELTESVELSYQLEHKAYQLHKKKGEIVLMALSCKHLLHLSKQIRLSKTIIEVYQKQLHRLMQTPEIYGISEETLFRNYEDKIKIGSNIAGMLQNLQTEEKLTSNDSDNGKWLTKAILTRLRKVALKNPNQNLQQMIGMVEKKGNQVLRFMENSPLVKEVIHEQSNRLEEGCLKMRQYLIKEIWKNVFLMLPPKFTSNQRDFYSNKSNKREVVQRQTVQQVDYNTIMNERRKKHKIHIIGRKTEKTPIKGDYHSSKSPLRAFRQPKEEKIFNYTPKHKVQNPLLKYERKIIQFDEQEPEKNYLKKQFSDLPQLTNRSSEDNFTQISAMNRPPISLRRKNQWVSPKREKSEQKQQRKQSQIKNEEKKEKIQIFQSVKTKTLISKIIDSQKEEVKEKNLDEEKEKVSRSNIGLQFQSVQIMVEPVKKEIKMEISKPKEENVEKKQKQNQKMDMKKVSNVSSMKKNSLIKHTVNSQKIRKCIKICNRGEYFMKRHFSSDGGEEKFVQLTSIAIKWSSDENNIDSKFQSYKLKDIRGVLFGKSSETFVKECNKSLEPWRCFSLVFQKRTLDFYCSEEKDLDVWLPAITASLHGFFLKPNLPINLYSPGRVLWKRMLAKLQYCYRKKLKKKHKQYSNANAYAIILFGKDNMKVPLSQIVS